MDTRPLHVRVKALADRYAAMAEGARKRAQASLQDAGNYQRDADTLMEAYRKLQP